MKINVPTTQGQTAQDLVEYKNNFSDNIYTKFNLFIFHLVSMLFN